MKLTDWAKREDLQLKWKQLWETEEALKSGLDVLREVALPLETKVPAGVDAVQYNAMMNSRREGYYDAIRNIEALKEIKRVNDPLPEPWSAVKQEE